MARTTVEVGVIRRTVMLERLVLYVPEPIVEGETAAQRQERAVKRARDMVAANSEGNTLSWVIEEDDTTHEYLVWDEATGEGRKVAVEDEEG